MSNESNDPLGIESEPLTPFGTSTELPVRNSLTLTSLGLILSVLGGLGVVFGVIGLYQSVGLLWGIVTGKLTMPDGPYLFLFLLYAMPRNFVMLLAGFLGVAILIAGYGLVRRRPWGRYLTLIAAIYLGLRALWGLFTGGEVLWLGPLLIYCCGVVVLLFMPHYAAEFVKPARPSVSSSDQEALETPLRDGVH